VKVAGVRLLDWVIVTVPVVVTVTVLIIGMHEDCVLETDDVVDVVGTVTELLVSVERLRHGSTTQLHGRAKC
jgi:hypothetical protein